MDVASIMERLQSINSFTDTPPYIVSGEQAIQALPSVGHSKRMALLIAAEEHWEASAPMEMLEDLHFHIKGCRRPWIFFFHNTGAVDGDLCPIIYPVVRAWEFEGRAGRGGRPDDLEGRGGLPGLFFFPSPPFPLSQPISLISPLLGLQFLLLEPFQLNG